MVRTELNTQQLHLCQNQVMRSSSSIGKEICKIFCQYVSIPVQFVIRGVFFLERCIQCFNHNISLVKILHRPTSAVNHSSCIRIFSKLTCKASSLINVRKIQNSQFFTNPSVELRHIPSAKEDVSV